MKIREAATLLSIIFLFWSCHGEKTQQKYHFRGKIGAETVHFSEYYVLGKKANMLSINRENKGGYNHFLYTDDNDDLKVEHVNICSFGKSKNNPELHYTWGDVDNKVMQEAQVQFDSYLEKIVQAKTAEALERLR